MTASASTQLVLNHLPTAERPFTKLTTSLRHLQGIIINALPSPETQWPPRLYPTLRRLQSFQHGPWYMIDDVIDRDKIKGKKLLIIECKWPLN